MEPTTTGEVTTTQRALEWTEGSGTSKWLLIPLTICPLTPLVSVTSVQHTVRGLWPGLQIHLLVTTTRHTGQVILLDKGQTNAERITNNHLFQGWVILQCTEYSTFIQEPFDTPDWYSGLSMSPSYIRKAISQIVRSARPQIIIGSTQIRPHSAL